MDNIHIDINLDLNYYYNEFATSFIITYGHGCQFDINDLNYNRIIDKYEADLNWDKFSREEVAEWLEDYFPDKEIYPQIKFVLAQLMGIIYEHKDVINNIAKDIVSKIEEHNNIIISKTKEAKERVKKKYSLETYVAPKGSKPITYNGITYKSKTQCKILNDLTDSELASIVNGKGIK